MAKVERRAAEMRGRRAERAAAWYLRLKGYRMLAHRYRTPVGEIDLVVKRGRQIAFVEVKIRGTRDDAILSVTAAGRRRIARAAAIWLAANPGANGLDFRFDVVLTVPWRWPVHIQGAFDADGNA